MQLNNHGSVKKRHVDDVDPSVARVGEGVDGRSEEEEARVLPGADVDERDVRCDAGDADAVDRRRNGAADVRAVAVIILVDRVDAAGALARTIDGGQVGDEVAARLLGEVRRDVGVVAIDAGVDDADEHTLAAALLIVGTIDSGADHLHVPLQVRERLGLVVAFAIIAVVRAGLVDGGQGGGNIGSSRIGLGGATDDAIARHADDGR